MPECHIEDCSASFSDTNGAVGHYEAEHDGVVYIDNREKDEQIISEVYRVCEERNVGVVEKKLDSGDYVYHGEEMSVAIEFKNITDAVNSALDDKLYEQADRMAQEYDRAFVFIVGKTSEVKLRGRNIGYGQAYGQILGTIPQILATMNMPVQWLQNEEQFADVGVRTLLDAGDKGLEDNELVLVSPGVSEDPRLGMLMGIDNIGESAAEDLLERAGGISQLAELDYTEILDIDGVGPTTARKVWNTINSDFESKGFDPKNKDHPMFQFLDTSGVGDDILLDIWRETDGLRLDPFEYVEEEYDLGSHRGEIVEEAIERTREELGIEEFDPEEPVEIPSVAEDKIEEQQEEVQRIREELEEERKKTQDRLADEQEILEAALELDEATQNEIANRLRQ